MPTINITQNHIDNGKKQDAYHSPLVLAILDKSYVDAMVTVTRIYAKGESGEYYSVNLPPDVAQWLADYNRGDKVEPTTFSFTLSRRGSRFQFLEQLASQS